MSATVDLNADAGEGFDDEALVPLVTSVSVACGFHAGGGETMARACVAAVEHRVAIGAHVSYRDRGGFGRRELGADAATIAAEAAEQIAALEAVARATGARVSYVKPHGALYHRASRDADVADALAGAAAPLALLGFPGSQLLAAAQRHGLVAVPEGFADRGYAPDGALLPRGRPGAVLDAAAAARQAVTLARSGAVRSICIHSDTAGAATVAASVRAALTDAGVGVRAFA